MKQTDLLVLGLAGLAVYMIVKGKASAKPGESSPLRDLSETVSEIFDSAGQAFSNGWRYYSNGTAIDPAGNYYFGGQLVWMNPAESNYQ